MNWDNVEMIRSAQASNKKRFDEEHIATQETIEKAIQSETFKQLGAPRLSELESMIFRLRSELIDYIVAHGLVNGLIFNGTLQPVKDGKIVITKDMIEDITEHLGYQKYDDVIRDVEQYLPEHFYVSDEHYTHTDNNYTTEEKTKLEGIETGAEVNEIIDLIYNGKSVLDGDTRVATITITPEDIKQWYESNPDTNAFTDALLAKLNGIKDGAEVNRVDDVFLDGESVVNDKKQAKLTKEGIKKSYESNPDTNCFTDAYMQKVDNNEEAINTIYKTKLSTITVLYNAIKDLTVADTEITPGIYEGCIAMGVEVSDSAGLKRTYTSIKLFGSMQIDAGGYMGMCSLAGNYRESAKHVLQTISFSMDDALEPTFIFYFDSSKEPGFIPATVNITYADIEIIGTAINAIAVDGEDQQIAHGRVDLGTVATKDYVDEAKAECVPYSGATNSVDLNSKDIQNVGTIRVNRGAIYGDAVTIRDGYDNQSTGAKIKPLTDGGIRVEAGTSTERATIEVADPTENNHATTKHYVDGLITEQEEYTTASFDSAMAYTDSKVNTFIPYTGATKAVDLGLNSLQALDVTAGTDELEYMATLLSLIHI